MAMNKNLAHEVRNVLERMEVQYGREFTAKYETIDPVKLHAAWMEELAGVPNVLDAMAWALHRLPERCPNLPQFRNLCQQAPLAQLQGMQRADAPTRGPTPEELAALHQLRDSIGFRRPSQQWAYDLIAKHERGEQVGGYPLRCAREVADMDTRKQPTPYDDDDLMQW